MAEYALVDSRNGIQETGANMDRESVVSTLFSSQSKGKRDRDQKVVHSMRDRHLNKILERKVDLAVRGERMAQQKRYEAEAEVEARKWVNIKQVDGQVRLREVRSACMENCN